MTHTSTQHTTHNTMSSNHETSERAPLLGNDGAVDGEREGGSQSKGSRWHRFEGWAAAHKLNIVLGLLAVMFFAFFVVSLITRLAVEHGNPAAPKPTEAAEVCTATGCVLASATLLRSISPR